MGTSRRKGVPGTRAALKSLPSSRGPASCETTRGHHAHSRELPQAPTVTSVSGTAPQRDTRDHKVSHVGFAAVHTLGGRLGSTTEMGPEPAQLMRLPLPCTPSHTAPAPFLTALHSKGGRAVHSRSHDRRQTGGGVPPHPQPTNPPYGHTRPEQSRGRGPHMPAGQNHESTAGGGSSASPGLGTCVAWS